MARAKKRRQDTGDDGPRKKSATAASSASRRITRLMTTDAPRKAVFATAELLESIFLYLPPKSVIGVQRTCCQFRDVVANSNKIQEHAFVRPGSNDVPWWQIESRYPGATAFTKLADPDTKLGPGQYRARLVRLHPLLRCQDVLHMYSDLSPKVLTAHQQAIFDLPKRF